MDKVIGLYLSKEGKEVLEELKAYLKGLEVEKLSKDVFRRVWDSAELLIFCVATGIVVRHIAGFLKDKKRDPGVLVISEDRKWVIPLCGGHQKEANLWAKKVADFLGASPVITTASDTKGLPALDIWIRHAGLVVENPENLPKVMAKFNSKKELLVYRIPSCKFALFSGAKEVSCPRLADVVITNRLEAKAEKRLLLVPKNLWIGIGLHEGVKVDELEEGIKRVLKEEGFLFSAVKGIATLDRKSDNPALKALTQRLGWKLTGFSAEELREVKVVSPSDKVLETVGTSSVSEAAAIKASKGNLVIKKKKFSNFTLAVAEQEYRVKGKLFVVGTGPGGIEHMTFKAVEALRNSELVIGYKKYIELVKPLLHGKEVLSYGMTEEVKRAKKGVEEALQGRIVALVSGGDPGVYGMAGVVLEVLAENDVDLDVEVIPGVTALCACSAVCGAPLMTDFGVLSLSDRLTPWEEILKRAEAFARLDIPVVIYNPRSRGRRKHLSKVLEVFLRYRKTGTPVAIVSNACRENQSFLLTNLGAVDEEKVNMGSTIIIGASYSFVFRNFLVTRRGYKEKYQSSALRLDF